jgi:hypothetical protein
MKTPFLHRVGDRWYMDTTTKVDDKEIAITVEPDRHHVALWLELQDAIFVAVGGTNG